MNRTEKAYALVIGIVVVLAAFLMFDGQILGDSTASWGRLLTIIGVLLITTGPKNVRFLQERTQADE